MSKNVTIISASLRPGSFSEALAHSFEKGASDAGHSVTFISLKGKSLRFCTGCCRCQESGRCVISDDATGIVETLRRSDVVVWSTPIYYYSMSGQMKTLIDRANGLYASEYDIKDVYLIATCADEDGSAVEGTLKGVEGWVGCLAGTRVAGVMTATGLPVDRTLDGTGFEKKAYDMGHRV